MKKLALLLFMAVAVFAASFNANAARSAQAPEAAQEETLAKTIINQDFLKYFEDNRQIKEDGEGNRVTGTVVVEFRVNQYSVPSAIQVVSGFSHETNREVINLLISSPRTWTPTDGERVRVVVEYK